MANTQSRQEALSGFSMSEPTARLIDGTVDLIRAHSGPDGTVFAFPHLSMLIGLADRKISGRVPVYWFDTCPDGLAREEAVRLLAQPPDVIVAMELSWAAFAAQEALFRGGAKSGQRDLYQAMFTLIRRDNYQVVGRFESPNCAPVMVLARPQTSSHP